MISRVALPFYRSRATWWVMVITGSFCAFALSPSSPPEWRDTPSLRWLHQLIPWPILAAGFVLYVLLLIRGTLLTTQIAEWLGLFFYLCGGVALLVTLRVDSPANPIAIAACGLACVLHFAAVRLATRQEADARERGESDG